MNFVGHYLREQGRIGTEPKTFLEKCGAQWRLFTKYKQLRYER